MQRPVHSLLPLLALVTALAGSQLACGRRPATAEPAPPSPARPALTGEVERLLLKKLRLVEALVSDPVIVGAVRDGGRQSQALTLRQIRELDRQWVQAGGADAFSRGLMTNSAAARLRDFQRAHAEFAEVFVTDAQGLNVCQSNKTSDYYQADESWWSDAMSGGKGRAFHGGIEYDESSRTRSLALVVPVMDPELATAIGVCKAVVNLDALGQEL